MTLKRNWENFVKHKIVGNEFDEDFPFETDINDANERENKTLSNLTKLLQI